MTGPKKEGPRDWDKELAEIDKLMASAPVPPPAPHPAKATDRRTDGPSAAPLSGPSIRPSAGPSKYARLFTWLRLGLGLTLGVAMTQWPYTNGCGLPLLAYLTGVLAVIVAAFWSMVSSWRTRLGFAHFLSVALLLWGAALAAREVLPRIGYAKNAATWQCVSIPAAAPAQPPATAPAPATSQPSSTQPPASNP